MIEEIIHWIVEIVEAMGYPGIFIMAALESTFVPIPSEATLIPAGYLIHQGKMDATAVFVLAVAGSITGSLLNYYIALFCGRYVLVKYGRWFFMNEEKLVKMERYFASHGSISIFLGRLILGVRHFISFPAGLAKMNLAKFCIYTGMGAAIWTVILLIIGYMIGDNKEMITGLIPELKIGCVVAVALIGGIYYLRQKKRGLAAPPS